MSALSVSTICPPLGKTTQMEVCLSCDDPPWTNVQISVDDQPLPVEDGLAHFDRTFSAPGIYPLQVRANTFGGRGSKITTEKTFFLHVNQ